MDQSPIYFQRLAAAFVRGKLRSMPARDGDTGGELFTRALDELAPEQLQAVIDAGMARGLRLHRFKRTMELPRVRKTLGILKGLQPANLLDIGSGRGAFLWPLLDAFPALPVTVVDILEYRVDDVQAVHAGGISQVSVVHGDATALPFADRSFDVVTMLEVLEHIPDTRRTLAEVCRVARRCVLLSVPSKADDNPEHIHLFDQQTLTALLREQGMARATFDYVLNHMIVVARV